MILRKSNAFQIQGTGGVTHELTETVVIYTKTIQVKAREDTSTERKK